MSRQLKVTGIPSSITKDSLTFFFENKRKSGGGDVEDVEYDEKNHIAIITFEEDDVVERVITNSKTSPLLLEQKIIEVEVYSSETSVDDTCSRHYAVEEEEYEDFFAIEINQPDIEKVSDDTLSLYFEGKRGANADILEMRKLDDESTVILRFASEEEINTVLQKSHTIGGQKIKVKRYIPPKPLPKYEDKVLITGINPQTTKDSLCNFLEAKTGVEPTDVTYGEEDGTALVSFTQNIEIENLKEKCKKRALEGSFLSVKEVTVTDTVLVTNFSETTTEETLQLYFENKRRSGVEEVKKIQMLKDEGQCFISFPDHNDVSIVCQRPHVVEGAKLCVKIHHPCLGNPLNIAKSLQFTVPPSFIMKEIDHNKLAFMKQSENKQSFEKVIEEQYGRIDWTKTHNKTLEVECTLQQTMKDCRKLARKWSSMIKRTVQRYMDALDVVEVNTVHEILEETRNDIISIRKEQVVVTIDEETNSLFVVGTSQNSKEVLMKIKDLVQKAEEEINEKKNRVVEKLKIKKYETDILSAINFQDNFTQDRDGVVVEIDVKNNRVMLTGKATHITNAKLKVIEQVREIEQKVVEEVKEEMLDFLKLHEVKSYVDKRFAESRVVATWNLTDDNKVVMFALSDEDLVKAIHIFRNSVSSSVVDVSREQKSILQTRAWMDLIQRTEKTDATEIIKITASDNTVSIYCSSNNDIGTLREVIEDYLYKNEKKQRQIRLTSSQKRFFQEQLLDELQNFERDTLHEGLKVDFDDDGIQLSGTESVLTEASSKIEKLRKGIVLKHHTIEKAGIVQHMKSQEGKAKVAQVERQNKVVIAIGDEDSEEPEEETNIKEIAECFIPSGQKIITVFGDITDLKANVLVNAANKQLNHCGGLARVVVRKGGEIIQTECLDHIKKRSRHNALSEGDVVCSSAGKLPFDMIAHVISPPYQDGYHNETPNLSNCIESALAETDKKDYKSVAIPAVGTGNYGFPTDIACLVIVDAIKDYFKHNKQTSIKEVFLCDISESTVQEFAVALKKKFPKSKVTEVEHRASKQKGQHRIKDDIDVDVASFDMVPNSGPINITVVQGLLAKQEVDVIVNSTSKDLQLTHGAVSTSLLKIGGDILQNECKQNYPSGVNPGDVAETSGGKLKCHKVYHGALNQWSSNALKEAEMFIINCLDRASKSGFECIAFPALGTGNLGYPKEEVAKLMFSSVENFGRNNPQTTLTDVSFIIYDKDTPVLKAFQSEQQERKRVQGQNTKRNTPGTQKQLDLNFDHATLKVYKGDLCSVNVGVIVNCTNVNFTSKPGSTSAVVFKNGGNNLSREIKTHGKNMKKEKIAITTAGKNFGSEFIMHLDVEDTTSDLKTKIRLVIDKMDEFRLLTVAFPVDDLGDSAWVGSSLSDVLQNFSGTNDIEVHCIVNDNRSLSDLEKVLQSATTQSPSIVSRFAGWVGIGGKNRKKPQLQISNVNHLSKLSIIVYGRSDISTTNAVRALESSLESAFTTEYVEDKLIKTLPKQEIDELESQLHIYGIDFEVNRRNGTIRITGLPENILPTINAIHTQLRQSEDMRHEREHAGLLSEMVQWFYIEVEQEGEKLVEYPKEVNVILEKAVRENKKKTDFRDKDGNVYIVDFNSYTEYRADNPKDVVNVIRRNKVTGGISEMPATWSPMKIDENIKLVTLPQTDSEYIMVATEFNKTLKNTIKKIKKIQNRTLYQQYMAKKQSMGSGKGGQVIERILWHGTKYEALDSINTYGFNRSYCGQNAVLYGNGVYFARDASYSGRSLYSPPDHNKQRYMYMCKVLTGDFVKGKEGLIVPPPKQSGGHLLYDSVVNDENDLAIFVIFHDTQAYPEYLILFE